MGSIAILFQTALDIDEKDCSTDRGANGLN